MRRFWRRREETPVVELMRSNPVRFGVVVLIVLVLIVYFGFTKRVPFKHGYRLKAEFASALNIHPKSPVRVAGVDVGAVNSVVRHGSSGLVTMEIESKGLPIHSDATLKIRPRIFLEGNWFVELQPGSPSARSLTSGATIPITQTSTPVQLDQVLDALNSDTRANLQSFLIEYGQALTKKPNAAEDAEQEADVRGINAAQALNKAYHRGPKALRATAVLNQSIGGTEPHDLSKLVSSIGRVTAALNVHEQQLGELIVNFNTFFSSFAKQSTSLRATVAELPSSLLAIDRGLASLDASFPPTRAFAHAIIPGVKQTNPTVAAALPWIEQVKASLQPSELGGVATGLSAAMPSLASLEAEQVPLFKQTELFNKCLTNVLFPAGNTKIQDGASTSGVEAYKEFWYSLVGLNSIGQSFDGNGTMGKFVVGNSGQTLRSAPVTILTSKSPGLRLLARSPLPPQGTRPAYPAEEPPYQPQAPCYKQALPNFNGPLSQGPADGTG
ncbi:MAG: phospholipid/cholesterol/gamma-HCH transport system substrate-binding protein [Solirubrobacteraceae bacterium]|jgi:ABC-type transporter Mla subunit MlaD|nr:phospholipid/cholesterol/gamma-HCH transport system substrate-binding protein [Solirubrobacteraceae bacterium]